MMRWNFDEEETNYEKPFTKGERYTLVVDRAEEGESKEKSTPFLKLHLKTEDGRNAYDRTLWLTNKAMFHAKPWFKALGFPDKGEVDIPVDQLGGIRLTAECGYKKSDDGTKEYLEWGKPEPVTIGGGVGQLAPAREPARETSNEDVPF